MENTNTLKFKPLMKEAWLLVKGMKGKVWLLSLFITIIIVVFNVISHIIQKNYPGLLLTPSMIFLTNAISCLLLSPFYTGIWMISLARVRGENIKYSTWTRYVKYFFSTSVVLYIIYMINAMPILINPISVHNPSSIYDLLLIPVITFFTYFFFWFAIYITIDKKVNPFRACMLSVKLVIKNFGICFKTYLFMTLITVLSFLLLFIPLLWTAPYICLLWALVYVRITE